MVGLLHGGLTSAGSMRFDGGLTWGLLAPARRFNGSCSSGHRQLLRPCVAQSVAQSVEQSVAHEGTLERLLQAPGRQWAHTWGAERGDFKSRQGECSKWLQVDRARVWVGGELVRLRDSPALTDWLAWSNTRVTIACQFKLTSLNKPWEKSFNKVFSISSLVLIQRKPADYPQNTILVKS